MFVQTFGSGYLHMQRPYSSRCRRPRRALFSKTLSKLLGSSQYQVGTWLRAGQGRKQYSKGGRRVLSKVPTIFLIPSMVEVFTRLGCALSCCKSKVCRAGNKCKTELVSQSYMLITCAQIKFASCKTLLTTTTTGTQDTQTLIPIGSYLLLALVTFSAFFLDKDARPGPTKVVMCHIQWDNTLHSRRDPPHNHLRQEEHTRR